MVVKRNIMFFLSQKKNSQPFQFRIAVLCTLFSESFTHPPENNKQSAGGEHRKPGRKKPFLDLSQRRWRLPGTWKPPQRSWKKESHPITDPWDWYIYHMDGWFFMIHVAKYTIPVPWILWEWLIFFFESRRKTHVSLRFHCGGSFLGYTYTSGCQFMVPICAECMEYLPTWMASFYGESLGIHSPSENGNGT